jgi:RNA polymerase sigma-70 factor (ECF subfamily)
VTEVFIVLTRRMDEAPDDILPWLYGVARKVLGNLMRSKRRRLALVQRIERVQGEGSKPHLVAPEVLRVGGGDVVIGQALSKLPAKDREVLFLVAWDELSYREAAESLGCTSTAFAQMLRRARQRMVEAIDQIRTCEADLAPEGLRE